MTLNPRRFICFILAFLPSSLAYSASNDVLKGVEIKLYQYGQLSTNELISIARLARECGITNVGKIETMMTWPPGDRMIVVSSVLRMDGRRETCEALVVHNAGWGRLQQKPRPSAKKIGDFWAEPGSVETNTWTVFPREHQEDLRIHLADAIPLKTADKIIDAICERRFKAREEDQLKINEVVPSQLTSLTIQQGKYEAEFYGLTVVFDLVNDSIAVRNVRPRIY